MGKIIDIPNKKINRSPQFRNLIPGEGVTFEPVDDRVAKVTANSGKVEAPVITIEDSVLTATCETEGAMIFFDAITEGYINLVLAYKDPIDLENALFFPNSLWAQKGGMLNSDIVRPIFPPLCKFNKYDATVKLYDSNEITGRNGEILYTLDGSDPVENGILYDGKAIAILEACTLKAVVDLGKSYSPMCIKTIQALTIGTNTMYDYANDELTITATAKTTGGSSVNAEIYYDVNIDPTDKSPRYDEYEQSGIYYDKAQDVRFIAYANNCIPSPIVTVITPVEVTPPVINVEVAQGGNLLASLSGIPEGGNGYFTIKYQLNYGSEMVYNEPFAVVYGDTISAKIIYDVTGQQSSSTEETVHH